MKSALTLSAIAKLLRYRVARWLAPGAFDRHAIRFTVDTSQAVATLEELRRDIERTAALADAMEVKCDITLSLRMENLAGPP